MPAAARHRVPGILARNRAIPGTALALGAVALALLQASRAAAAVLPENPPWIELKAPTATVYSQADPSRTREFALQLERFRTTLPQVTKGLAFPEGQPVIFFAFRDGAAMAPYEPHGLESVPGLLGGFYLGDKRGGYVALRAYLPGDPLETVFHEMIHAAQFRKYDSLPLWLQEGEADYYSTLRIEGSKADVGLANGRHVQWFLEHPPEPLTFVFNTTGGARGRFERDQTLGFYATSWALVHFLRHSTPARRAMFEKYQADLAAGVAETKAHLAAFGMNRAELETAFREYVKAGNFVSEPIAVTMPPIELAAELPPANRAHLLARLALLLLAPATPKLAAAAEHARAAAAIAPDDPVVLGALGTIEYRSGRCAASVPIFRKAIGDAAEATLLIEGASALLCIPVSGEPTQFHSTEKLDDKERERILLARAWLRRGLQTYPEDVNALSALGLTYVRLEDAPAEGIPPLEAAIRLDPRRDDATWNLFELYLATGARDRALALVEGPIRKRSSSTEYTRAHRRMLEFDMHRASKLLGEGQLDEPLDIVKGLVAAETDPEAKARLTSELARFEAHVAKQRQINDYNTAVALVRGGKSSEALRAFRKLAETCQDPDVCANAKKAADALSGAGVRP